MPVYAGVDGAPGGWICALFDSDERSVSHVLAPDASRLFALREALRVETMAIDIPIGLPEVGLRTCDLEARALLKPHRLHSVFPTPLREAIEQPTWDDANRLSRARCGRGISKQAWNITPKIRDVDALITPDDQRWMIEVHPELCFAAWSGSPMSHSKKTPEGRAEREDLIDEAFGADARAEIRQSHPVKDLATDDINDAFAALYCAMKRGVGAAERIPAIDERDRRGLLMEMWW